MSVLCASDKTGESLKMLHKLAIDPLSNKSAPPDPDPATITKFSFFFDKCVNVFKYLYYII